MQEIAMPSRVSFRRIVVLVSLIVLVGGSSLFAESAKFPTFSRDQYGTRMLFYSFVPAGGDTAIQLGSGYFQAVLDNNQSIIGSTFVSDNCRKNDGSCGPTLAISFAGPADAHGFRSPRFVKNVHFRLAAGPGTVKVCGAPGDCQLFSPDQFRNNGGFVDVTFVQATGGVRASFLTDPLFNVSWHFQTGDHVDFTPVAHADHPIVFVPGIAASELRDDNDQTLWPSLSPFIFGSAALSLDPADAAPPLHATDVLRELPPVLIHGAQDVYGEFLGILAANRYTEYSLQDPVTHHFDPSRLSANCVVDSPNPQPKLFVFPYDWRRPNAQSAAKLADYIQCIQRYYPDQTVDIVAHSMGGLVARRMLLDHAAARASVRQVVTVATPYLGAAKAIGVEYDGSFMTGIAELITAPTFKKLAPYYPGVHELLPSRPSFPPSINAAVTPSPFRFSNYDPNQHLSRLEVPWYDPFVDLVDLSFPATRPGSVGRAFHDRPSQDDWSDNSIDTPTTQYFGTEAVSETITTVTRKQTVLLRHGSGGTYYRATHEGDEFAYGVGDGTVPRDSAKRPDALLGSAKKPVQLTGSDDQMLHNHLPKTAVRDIITLLSEQVDGSVAATTAARLNATSEDALPASPYLGTAESVYVRLIGSGPIVLSSLFSPLKFDSSIKAPQIMTGVAVNAESEDSWSLVLDRNTPYTVTFTATEQPFQIEVFTGLSNVAPRLASRFMDVNLTPGTVVTLQTQTLAGFPGLTYDGPSGSGAISPSNISSPGFVDLTPPEVSISGTSTITIAASDSDSGLWRIFYSTDGTQYRPYVGPFTPDPTVDTISAFADDFDGNRSDVVTYPLVTLTRPTSLVYSGNTSGTVGVPLNAAVRLTTAGDGGPLAAQAVVFQCDSKAVTSTTGSDGVATAVFTPAHAGPFPLTVTFAGTASLGGATVNSTVAINKAVPIVTWNAPASVTYGTQLGSAQLNASSNVPGVFSYAPAAGVLLGAGTHGLSVVFTPSNSSDYESATGTTTLAVTPAPLTIRPADATMQYGSPLPAFEATYIGFVAGQTPATLNGTLVYTTSVTPISAPGEYAIGVSGVSSPNYAISFVPGQVTVRPQAARVTFTGARFASTTGMSTGTMSLVLAATVQGELDGSPGDLSKATLTFVNRTTNTALCTAALKLIGTTTPPTASGTCLWKAPLAANAALQVGSVIGGYYRRDSTVDDAVVELQMPADHFLTGGGFLIASRSAGSIHADAGSPVSFNLEARYKTGQPALQGRASLTVRHTDDTSIAHTYEITLAVPESLATNAARTQATLTGAGAKITDVTDSAHPIVVASDAIFELTATQESSGHLAQLAVTVWNPPGGLWFASAWTGTNTAEQPVGGGGVQIH